MSGGKLLAVAAGKGGTGKTLVATSLALALHERAPGSVSLLDCDVEEPNAHLILRPTWESEVDVCIRGPQIDLERCTRCGLCASACHASAIAVVRDAVVVFDDLCSGCGLCAYLCPEGAIREVDVPVGTLRAGYTATGLRVVSGELRVGRHRATRLISAVRAQAQPGQDTVVDAPPGTACTLHAAVDGADLCWLVTEPTPFGRSDLQAAREVCAELGVPSRVVLNRDEMGGARDDLARTSGQDLILRIPHDRRIAEAYAEGRPLVESRPEWKPRLTGAWDRSWRQGAAVPAHA